MKIKTWNITMITGVFFLLATALVLTIKAPEGNGLMGTEDPYGITILLALGCALLQTLVMFFGNICIILNRCDKIREDLSKSLHGCAGNQIEEC